MNRRTLIKQIAIMLAGAAILPSCKEGEQTVISLDKIKLPEGHLNSIIAVAETIIPATDTPGAKELSVYVFLLKMLNDCYEPNVQTEFITGLGMLDKTAQTRFNENLGDCTPAQLNELLTEIGNKKEGFQKVEQSFYWMMKELTIQGYTSSEYVMTNFYKYQQVPGRFYGSVKV
jgi:hypothetical protein